MGRGRGFLHLVVFGSTDSWVRLGRLSRGGEGFGFCGGITRQGSDWVWGCVRNNDYDDDAGDVDVDQECEREERNSERQV